MSAGVMNIDRARASWWALGSVLAVVVLYVLYSFIGTFVFGVFLYYATRPLYTRVRLRVRPPSLAAVVSLLVLALPVLILLAYTVAIGLQEFTRLSQTTNLGRFETYLQPYFNVSTLLIDPQQILTEPSRVSAIQNVLNSATRYLGFLGNAALHLFVMIAIAFYLLRDDHKLSRWVRRRFADDAGVLEAYLDAVDHDFHHIFFGNILNAVITATIGALMYNVLAIAAPSGVAIPYPSLLGLLAGIASLIPIVGMKLVYFPATGYLAGVALFADAPELLWFPAAFFLISFVVVDTIPDLVLRPYVSGRSLHVGMVMFAYIFGPLLFGWYGIFLGPMLLVFVIHFTRIVLPELVTGDTVKPVAVDPGYLTEPSQVAPDEFGPSGSPESVSGAESED